MSRVSVDSIQLSDLAIDGWLGIGLAGGGVFVITDGLVRWITEGADPISAVVVGVLLTLVGGILAYESAAPEFEGHCDSCGQYIRSHSSRDGADEVVRVEATGTPRRAKIGPLSFVLQRKKDDRIYCSGECAAGSTRVLMESHDHETIETAEVEDAV